MRESSELVLTGVGHGEAKPRQTVVPPPIRVESHATRVEGKDPSSHAEALASEYLTIHWPDWQVVHKVRAWPCTR
jgi:hypothetical protein